MKNGGSSHLSGGLIHESSIQIANFVNNCSRIVPLLRLVVLNLYFILVATGTSVAAPEDKFADGAGDAKQAITLTAPKTLCDELTASIYDPLRVADVVPEGKIRPEAIQACRNALKDFPGDPRIKANLAKSILDNGFGDIREVVNLVRESADSGNAYGAFMYYVYLSSSGDIELATQYLILSLEGGSDAVFQKMVRFLEVYPKNKGANVNIEILQKWSEVGAAQNLPIQLIIKGLLVEKGIEREMNLIMATELYERAFNKGNMFSAYKLIKILLEKNKYHNDVEKIRELLLYIIGNNNYFSEYYFNETYNIYTNFLFDKYNIVKADQRLSGLKNKIANWLEDLANTGNPVAQLAFAKALFEGAGVTRNQELAIQYVRLSAQSGFEPAVNVLNVIEK